MTDFDRQPDDEIVSAYLDGEATPEEAALVEREPALQARLAAFRAAGAEVARPPAAADADRERHLRRAREALAEGDDNVASVHLLDAARRRRRTYVLSAAAVVAVLLLGAALVPVLRDDSPEVTAVGPSTDARSLPDEAADTEASPEPAADQGAAAATLPATDDLLAEFDAGVLPYLGSFATRQALDLELAAVLPTDLGVASLAPDPVAPSARDGAAASCLGDVFALDPELVDVVYGASADLADVPVQVLVFRTDPTSSANSALRRYLVDPTTCQALVGGIGALGS
jgi:hypothetical protein